VRRGLRTLDGARVSTSAITDAALAFPTRLVPDLLAALGRVEEPMRFDRLLGQVTEQAESVELTNCVRQEVDAHPERLDLGGRLEHVDVETELVEAQGGGESPDAADDGSPHSPTLRVSPSCTVG
jgi:hypothetical protein